MPRADQKLIPFAWPALGLVLATALGARLAHERDEAPVHAVAVTGEIPPWREWLADWAYVQADVYFQRGTAPGLFTRAIQMAGEAPCETLADGMHAHGDAPARDWIEAFGRDFHAWRHTHLGDDAENGLDDGQVRELLPWVRLAVKFNPRHTEAWLLGSYFLREHLYRDAEAEQFLTEAVRHNPGHYEIHFALGQLAEERHRDAARARAHWLRALRDWQARGPRNASPLAWRRIVGSLARLEERAGRVEEALHHVGQLLAADPESAAVQAWAARLRAMTVVKAPAGGE
jgi:tetratricopeptide (TPR) repeat protein